MERKEPLILCLTNTVAANFTANVLLAIGAKPAMIEDAGEAAELAAKADATLVNVGTLHARQAEAMLAAVAACEQADKPWVLDPVAVHLLDYRRKFVESLLASHTPAIIRGNQAEIDFLYHTAVESVSGTVLLATGEIDAIYTQTPKQPKHPNTQASQLISGGVPLLQSVTATGCAQGAICAAMLGRGLAPLEAACEASRLMKRAGELAYSRAKTPGSFKVALVDALWELGRIR